MYNKIKVYLAGFLSGEGTFWCVWWRTSVSCWGGRGRPKGLAQEGKESSLISRHPKKGNLTKHIDVEEWGRGS